MKVFIYVFLVVNLNLCQSQRCNTRFDVETLYYPGKMVNVFKCERVTPTDLTAEHFFGPKYPVFAVDNSHLVSVYKEMFANMEQRRNIQAVAMTNSHIKNIIENAFEDFQTLHYLDLRHNEISEVNFLKSIFVQIGVIDLSHNDIEQFSVSNLPQPNYLETLILSSNKIITLDIAFAQNVTSLYALDLSYNSIANFKEDTFRNVPYLAKLYLTNSSNHKIDFNIFSNVRRLKFLNISNNVISVPQLSLFTYLYALNLSATNVAVDQKMFLQSERLNDLDLSWNGLKKLDEDVFIYLKGLKFLYLNNNNLKTLKRDIFKNLNQTLFLTCASNQINRLQENVFSELISLRSLHLNNNGLETIDDGAFNSLYELRELDLSENKIEVLSEMAFKGLGILLELRLNKNLIKSFSSKPFWDLASLVSLGISNNPYHVVEANAFMGLTSLNSLNLSRLSITDIQPNAFASFKLLYILDVSYNSIKTLYKDAFNLPYKIAQVLLNDNYIKDIQSGAFVNLSFKVDTYASTNYLGLNRNNIQILKTQTFAGITNIEVLNLEDNKIELIEPYAFENCVMLHTGLAKIILSNNKLTVLEKNTFAGLQNLKGLELRNNAITTVVADSFNGLGLLNSLILTGNLIENLPLGSFRHFSNLCDLQLAENLLASFEVGFFSNLPKLEILNISHNGFVAIDVNVLYPLRSLHVLPLDLNCLTELNYSALLKYHEFLKHISVNDNNWSCSYLIEMLKAFRDGYVNYLFNTTSTFKNSSIEGISCSNTEQLKKTCDIGSKTLSKPGSANLGTVNTPRSIFILVLTFLTCYCLIE